MIGDFNARTGNFSDFITTNDFIANVQNCNNGFHSLNEGYIVIFESLRIQYVRKVTDTTTNNFEYKLIGFCTNNNIKYH